VATEPPPRNPFVGPLPFERKDADLFFGRVGEVQELVSRIVANRVVVLYAASGAGKTSLLNAGVLPLLEREERFEVLPSARFSRVAVADDAGRSVENVYVYTTLLNWSERAVTLSEPSELTPEPSEAPASAATSAVTAETTLGDFLTTRGHLRDARGRPLPRVVVFDQFEEIFTVNPEYWEHREEFFRELADALDADRYLRVVLALREDYVAQLEQLLPLLPSYVRFRLEQLSRDGAIEAVTGPVAKAGRSFGTGVAEALVQDLQTLRVDVGGEKPTEMPGEFVEPVQLQVVCQSLWSELPPDVKEITEQHTHTFGDVDEVLERFYDDAVRAAAKAAHVRGKRLRQWVEDAFITSVGTRSTIYRTAESTADIPNAAIEELEDRHLIRGDWRAGARWYELTHDRFIGPIQSSNARFRAEASRARRRRLRTAVGVLASLLVVFGVTWSFTSVFAEPLEPLAALSLESPSPVLNVNFASYQQLSGRKPSGSKGQRARNGNLVRLQITTQGLRKKFLVIESSTIDAKSHLPVRDDTQRVVQLLRPESNRENSLQEIWIPLLPRSGRFAYLIRITTQDGIVLDQDETRPFTIDANEKAVSQNVVLLALRVVKTGRGFGTVVSSPSGIDCGSTCSSEYAKGTRVNLLAFPARQPIVKSLFTGWARGCSGSGGCTVTVAPSTVVVADFARAPRRDVVAFTGGIGVRYRYSPRMANLVPGNGPFEGDRVTIYCYTKGERVKGNSYWVKIALTPDRYIPATYLRHGHSGRPPGDVSVC
jgi:hypothetical protein